MARTSLHRPWGDRHVTQGSILMQWRDLWDKISEAAGGGTCIWFKWTLNFLFFIEIKIQSHHFLLALFYLQHLPYIQCFSIHTHIQVTLSKLKKIYVSRRHMFRDKDKTFDMVVRWAREQLLIIRYDAPCATVYVRLFQSSVSWFCVYQCHHEHEWRDGYGTVTSTVSSALKIVLSILILQDRRYKFQVLHQLKHC